MASCQAQEQGMVDDFISLLRSVLNQLYVKALFIFIFILN
jgi:hypothetical protein